jgi:hypothetical protein
LSWNPTQETIIMRYPRLAVAAGGLGLLLAVGTPAAAQGWTPPSRQMPSMQVADGWQGSMGGWFLPGTALNTARAQSDRGYVRFSAGPRPVAAWSDRNGDGRCDILELFRGGAVAYQLVDADYDGRADVLRIYDDAGQLQRTERL